MSEDAKQKSFGSPQCCLVVLDERNWTAFEKSVMDDMASFGDAGKEILENKRKDWEICEPIKTTMVTEKLKNSDTGAVTSEERPWNSKSDATELMGRILEWRSMQNRFLNQRGKIWAYLTRSISREIRTRLDLDTGYRELQVTVNTFDLFEMLRKHSTEIATSNAQALGNNWRNLRFLSGRSLGNFW